MNGIVIATTGTAWGLIATVALVVAGIVLTYVLLAKGSLTLDLGWGRSMHPLGPIVLAVAAPREIVFEQISAPYLGRMPRELRDKVEVLERGEGMVIAAHRTKVRGFVTITVEAVAFDPPERVRFRLLRGPVPHVVEHFLLHEVPDGGTELEYAGELGADLWVLGRLWGRRVAKIWVGTVAASLERIKAGSEERARAQERRAGSGGAPET